MREFPGLRHLVACSLFIVLLSAAAWAETDEGAGEPRNVALLRMELPRGYYADERVTLANGFLHALQSTGRFEIVAREDLDAILQELRFQATDLVDEEEVVELGELAGVDLFATCNVTSFQGVYQITAKLISVETAKVDKSVSRRCAAKVDFLAAMFNEIAFELAGEEEKKGLLLIETDPPEANVYLFGVLLGTSPVTLKMAPGTYLFSVDRRGYTARRKTLYVASGQETSWKVELIKKRRFRLGDYVRGGGFWARD
jgi:hypothetical protein